MAVNARRSPSGWDRPFHLLSAFLLSLSASRTNSSHFSSFFPPCYSSRHALKANPCVSHFSLSQRPRETNKCKFHVESREVTWKALVIFFQFSTLLKVYGLGEILTALEVTRKSTAGIAISKLKCCWPANINQSKNTTKHVVFIIATKPLQ